MNKILNRANGDLGREQIREPVVHEDSKNMILSARNIHRKYQQGSSALHILKGVDLDINEGDVLSLVGPSGAGKSTLLHILGGLDKPNEGDVLLDGKNVYTVSDAERSRIRNLQVGFVFQFYHLLPEFTALENVALPALITSGTGKSQAATLRAR